jgi:hypothetical protein
MNNVVNQGGAWISPNDSDANDQIASIRINFPTYTLDPI